MAAPAIDPDTEAWYVPNQQSNMRSRDYVKSTTASIAGSTAGVLGLTNSSGFLFYIFTSLVVGSLFSYFNCHGQPSQYFAKGGRETVLGGLLDNAFPFVLFWTLFYSLVHIYD